MSLRNIYELRQIRPETRPLEFLSAFYATWWTLLLLAPVHLFASNAAFLGLSTHGSEHVWASVIGASALLEWAAWIYPQPITRSVSLFISGTIWMFVACCIGLTSVRYGPLIVNTGFGVYGMTACVRFWAWYRLIPNAISDVLNIVTNIQSHGLLRKCRCHNTQQPYE